MGVWTLISLCVCLREKERGAERDTQTELAPPPNSQEMGKVHSRAVGDKGHE